MGAVEGRGDDQKNDPHRHQYDRASTGEEGPDREGEHERREAEPPQECGRIRCGV
jgi:hypothetical protein